MMKGNVMNERENLVVALSVVKDEIRKIERAYNLNVPVRAGERWHRLTKSAEYIERKLIELNQREGLYGSQDSHR